MPFICPNPGCGAAECEDSRYCSACGEPLNECGGCQHRNEAQAETCENCGADLTQPLPTEEEPDEEAGF